MRKMRHEKTNKKYIICSPQSNPLEESNEVDLYFLTSHEHWMVYIKNRKPLSGTEWAGFNYVVRRPELLHFERVEISAFVDCRTSCCCRSKEGRTEQKQMNNSSNGIRLSLAELPDLCLFKACKEKEHFSFFKKLVSNLTSLTKATLSFICQSRKPTGK